MKQTLQLRLGQQLAMTPQLQQAIRLLQLSTLELQTEVQQALDSNLMLELEEDGQDGPAGEPDRVAQDSGPDEAEVEPTDIPGELATDSAWEDVYDLSGPGTGNGAGSDGPDVDLYRGPEETLAEHLAWQVGLMRLGEEDRAIAAMVVDAIDDDGYLHIAPEEIAESLCAQGVEVGPDEVWAVVHLVQSLDPPGVGARDLADCLAIQLRQLPEDTPWRREAEQLVTEHLALLAGRDFAQLMRALRLDEGELQAVVGLIQRLSPRPGAALQEGGAEYVVPDVFVRKVRGTWRVELNPDAFPRLRVNSGYAALIRRGDSSAENSTMRAHLQEARWFIKSLRSRSETLLKVAACIVERQRAFLEEGEEAMKPMVLHDVAEAVGMHESTISRVTTQKYMHTPRGIFELKYFFSSHVYTRSGGECSSTAIRALLRKLIAAENARQPLSDNRLASVLAEQGINVARRTVAKYREAMGIPSSSERKSLA